MSQPFLGEIRPWAITFAPKGWAFCAGQLLPISQNSALFSLLGTLYGGNGTSNFQLPDLRGRVPLKYGQSIAGDSYDIGETGGEETVTLTALEMPTHTHTFAGTADRAGRSAPADKAALGADVRGESFYSPDNASLTPINPGTLAPFIGDGGAHENRQPYVAINWCIALAGIYPARN